MRSLMISALTVLTIGLVAKHANAVPYTNNTLIINGTTVAEPYPSEITVSGFNGPIGNISIRLNDAVWASAGTLSVVLAAPNGRTYALSVRCGGMGLEISQFPSFSPSGTLTSNPLSTGSNLPKNCAPGVSLPAPAPAGPYVNSLDDLIGTDPNGTWRLYVDNKPENNPFLIQGGWTIFIDPPTPQGPPSAFAFTYQGKLENAGVPFIGQVYLRARIYDQPENGTQVGSTLLIPITVEKGRFTTLLDFGQNVHSATQPRYLDLAVNGVSLGSRQRLTSAPSAVIAARANTADSALSADFATNSTNAVNATNAENATNAVTAQGVAWSGISNIPANVQSLKWQQATTVATGSYTEGWVGVMSQPISPLTIGAPFQGVSVLPWQLTFANPTLANFRGGIRLADNGFLELTNTANLASPSFARLNSVGAWSSVSDARLKKNVELRKAEQDLSLALQLQGVNFRWSADGREDFGLIAQDVQTLLPELVMGNESREMLTVNYAQLSVITLGAVKQLKLENDQLREKNRELEQRIDRLERLLNAPTTTTPTLTR